jgi:osmotically-inducible protein OsmY
MPTLAEPFHKLDDVSVAPAANRSSRGDDEIALAVATVLDWSEIPAGGISATVDDGRVTLEGTVGFRYQRQAAERAVRRMAGVRAVDNQVQVATTEAAEKMREAIKSSIRRRLVVTDAMPSCCDQPAASHQGFP